jgi:hypothetical protein
MAPALSADGPAPLHRTHWTVQLLAAAGMVAVAGIIIVILILVAIGIGNRTEYQPAKVAGEKRQITFTVGNPMDLAGTQLLKMDVAASEADGNSYGSGRGQDTRNILLIDKNSGAARRLLPDNSRRISRASFLSGKGDVQGDDDRVTDGNANGAITAPIAYYLLELPQPENAQHEDLLVGTLANGRQAVVMRGLDGIDRFWMRNPDQIALIVRDGLKLYYRVVDIPLLKVVESRPIAID